jgi:serine protease
MATPHVAAVAALMLSVNSALTPDEVEARLKSSAKAFPATCSQCGSGLLDASAAIDAAKGTTPTTTAVAETTASNNTIATAQAITAALPVLITGSVSSSDLSDYYAVTLAAGKTLTATLTPPSSADFDLYIYNASGTQLASSEAGTGSVDTASVTNSGTASITVYVRAYRYSGSGTYTLGLK